LCCSQARSSFSHLGQLDIGPRNFGSRVTSSASSCPRPRSQRVWTDGVRGRGIWHAVARPVDGRRLSMRRHCPAGRNSSGRRCVDGHASAVCAPVLGLDESRKRAVSIHGAVQPAYARTLVAAFNGGFVMNVAKGGYYTEGRVSIHCERGGILRHLCKRQRQRWRLGQRLVDDLTCRECASELGATRGDGHPPRPRERIGTRGVRRAASIRAPSQFPASIINGDRVSALRQRSVDLCNGPGLSRTVSPVARARPRHSGMELDINSSWPDYSTYDPPVANGSRRRQTGASSLRQPCKVLGRSSNLRGRAISSRCPHAQSP